MNLPPPWKASLKLYGRCSFLFFYWTYRTLQKKKTIPYGYAFPASNSFLPPSKLSYKFLAQCLHGIILPLPTTRQDLARQTWSKMRNIDPSPIPFPPPYLWLSLQKSWRILNQRQNGIYLHSEPFKKILCTPNSTFLQS